MSKLVDKERLARLALALDSRAKAAVEVEKQRALAAETRIEGKADTNAAAIAAINNETTGILAKSKAYADGKVAEVNSANEALTGKVATLEASDAEQTKKITALEAKDSAHDSSIAANTAAIAKLNGAATEAGSVAKAVKDAVDPLKTSVSTLEGKVGKEGEGDVAATGLYKKIADGDKATLDAAKLHAETKIAELVDSAPEAMNTLKELADAITAHEGVYDAYVAQIAKQMETKVDKVEGSRLITNAEAAQYAAKADVAQVEAAKQEAKTYAEGQVAPVSAKVTTLEGTVGTIKTDITGLKAKDGEHDTAIADAKAKAEKGISDAAAVAARATALEKLVGTKDPETGLCKEISDNKKAITALQSANEQVLTNAKAYTDEKIGVVNGTVSGVKADVDQLKVTVGSSTSGLVKDIADLKTKDSELNRLITANAAAITTLNGNATTVGSVDKKILDALASYSNTEEIKQILGNVVNSLSLSIADNKIKLSLGSGVEGITVTETTLDLATDADIDAIISSLDAPKGYKY